MFDKLIQKFNLSSNKIKVFKNLYWAILGKIVNILGSLLVGVFVARYLGTDDFGLMNYVISYVALFSVISSFGIDNIEIRELSKKKINRDSLIGTSLVIRLILSIITLILIYLSLVKFESDLFTRKIIMIYSFSVVFNSFNVIRNYFTAIVQNEYVVKTEISRTIIGAVIKIVLLFINAPLEWFILAITFDFFLVTSGLIYAYRLKVSSFRNWKFDKKICLFLIKESFPVFLSATAIIIYQKIDQLMLRNMISDEALGLFSAASKVTEIGIFIPTIIAQTLTPFLVRTHENNVQQYFEMRHKFMSCLVWTSIVISFLISISSHISVNILFGQEYKEAVYLLQVMAWKIFLISLFIASGQIIIIEKLQKFAVLRNIGALIISVVLNLILIPKYGIIGSIWAMIIAFSFSGYFSHLLIKPYNFMFSIQTRSIFTGWRSVYKELKILINKKNFSNEFK